MSSFFVIFALLLWSGTEPTVSLCYASICKMYVFSPLPFVLIANINCAFLLWLSKYFLKIVYLVLITVVLFLFNLLFQYSSHDTTVKIMGSGGKLPEFLSWIQNVLGNYETIKNYLISLFHFFHSWNEESTYFINSLWNNEKSTYSDMYIGILQ